MYFTPDSAHALVARLTRSLAPGGHLFLGHAETLRGLSNDYHLRHTHGTFYYQRKHAQGEARRGGSEDKLNGAGHDGAAPRAMSGAVPPPPEPAWTKTWLETIQQASDRILSAVGTAACGVRAARRPKFRRFGANRGAVAAGAGTPEGGKILGRPSICSAACRRSRDKDVLLLRAALLTHSGQLGAAEDVSTQLLEDDELNSGAHYLLALCRESAGDGRARSTTIRRQSISILALPCRVCTSA